MGLFSKSGSKDTVNGLLGQGTIFQGRLDFSGTVVVEGEFEGEVRTPGVLMVGPEASVKGTVQVGELIVAGRFAGNVHAEGKVVLRKSARALMRAVTPSMVVEEGAAFDGQVRMIRHAVLSGGPEGLDEGEEPVELPVSENGE